MTLMTLGKELTYSRHAVCRFYHAKGCRNPKRLRACKHEFSNCPVADLRRAAGGKGKNGFTGADKV